MSGKGVGRVRGVFDDLVRFETALWNATDDRLQREAGVSLASLNALLVIQATPDCRVQDVARALAITVGGTSQAVDRIEKAGWCVRRTHPTDRRSSVIELTDAGAAIVQRADPVFDAALQAFLVQPLPNADFDDLAESLALLRRHAVGPGRAPA